MASKRVYIYLLSECRNPFEKKKNYLTNSKKKTELFRMQIQWEKLITMWYYLL